MYKQFEEAIQTINNNLGSRFEVIGDVIIAAIKGAIALAVTIVDSLASVITTVVESSERVLTSLFRSIVSTVDLMLTGVKDIIGGTINTLVEYFRWLWGEITALLDKMLDFDIDNLSVLFVTLVEAQQKAFAFLKERSETVQP